MPLAILVPEAQSALGLAEFVPGAIVIWPSKVG
jgi:hypothetical protein